MALANKHLGREPPRSVGSKGSQRQVVFWEWLSAAIRPFYDLLHKGGEVPVAREQRKLAAILAADVVGTPG